MPLRHVSNYMYYRPLAIIPIAIHINKLWVQPHHACIHPKVQCFFFFFAMGQFGWAFKKKLKSNSFNTPSNK